VINVQIDVILTPSELNDINLSGRSVSVIDVLRATTTMVAALDAGCRDIIPCPSVEEATRLADTLGRENVVLCGERDGNKINGFDLGNSPLEFTEQTVGNKTLLMSTTNGTTVISRAKPASVLSAAGFVNAGAVSGFLALGGNDVILICSGKLGRFSLEDMLCAGLIGSLITERISEYSLTDGARMAISLYKKEGKSLLKAFKQSQHGAYLVSLGYLDDLKYASQIDISRTIPVFKDGRIVKI
jgi:2-phosphosulfolactate phosphatase